MKIAELFLAEITRDIPPVVYFHEQSPAKLEAEVGEYIITGGHAEGDRQLRDSQVGVHEQLVHLLSGFERALRSPDGAALPASWISGFFGSGKSSFAKLLGLALDGRVLPSGQPLAEALLQRDTSPRRQELESAWAALLGCIEPMAVVFDLGGVAQVHEHLHSAALRQVQARLGYCTKSARVADFELRLERDGEWELFSRTALSVLGKEWSRAKEDAQAEDHFSHVLHGMKPERYPEPTSWLDSRAGAEGGIGSSVREVVVALEAMLKLRAPDKTLFLVVDEVSQYLHRDERRRLTLQSFVSELGQRLKGRVWLLATGQQRLDESPELSTLLDRFAPSLRVHLDTTNIHEVVHERLLKKKPEHQHALRALFQQHRSELKLYGHACEQLTEDDFVEMYPLLPGHIDLLMQVTSSLRTRVSRARGEEPAIRGLLQLLCALFREQGLAEAPLGRLVTLDAIYEVLSAALDIDVQAALGRLLHDPRLREDVMAQRVAKTVALLELIQEQIATRAELVAACLYARLGDGNGLPEVSAALEKLRGLGMLSYSERLGFQIQSSAGQEWQREREDLGVTREHLSEVARAALLALVGSTQERVRWKGRVFPWALWFSDGARANELRLLEPREGSAVVLDVRYLSSAAARDASVWVPKSSEGPLRERLVWVVGAADELEELARQRARSERMLERYRPRRDSLSGDKQRLLLEEEARCDELEGQVRAALAEALLEGAVYFRGQQLRPRESSVVFGSALCALALRLLPDLYPHFTELTISAKELEPLLDKELSGPSTKLMEQGLGVLSLDAGRYVATCSGLIPSRVLKEIEGSGGCSGQALLGAFVAPPYGYPSELVKACCAGLLRAKRLRIRTEHGSVIESHLDPGARDLFSRERDFRRAELLPVSEGEISSKDRIAIRKLLQKLFENDQEPEDEPIADTVFQQFPPARERLRALERRVVALPGRSSVPQVLVRLGRALDESCRSRFVQQTVSAVQRNLGALREGFAELERLEAELTDEAFAAVVSAAKVREVEWFQLQQVDGLGAVREASAQLVAHLASEQPWRERAQLGAWVESIRRHYAEVRAALLQDQGEQVELAIRAMKIRASFARLDAESAHRALRPLREMLPEAAHEATSPTLLELRERFITRIGPAQAAADAQLDAALGQPAVALDLCVGGREIESREQLEALLREVEERVAPHLAHGGRVRLL